jgi:hypothetical protein
MGEVHDVDDVLPGESLLMGRRNAMQPEVGGCARGLHVGRATMVV